MPMSMTLYWRKGGSWGRWGDPETLGCKTEKGRKMTASIAPREYVPVCTKLFARLVLIQKGRGMSTE